MNFSLPALIAAAIFSVIPRPAAASAEEMLTLDSLKWKNRALVIVTSDDRESNASLESKLLRAKEEIDERDLLYFIVGDSARKTNAPRPLALSESDAQKRFPLKGKTHTVYLIGKDGGIKLVQNDRLDLKAIFERIDQMPMRMDEMRSRKIPK
ncbi:DUF4174 domain-containing protein [Oscillatoria amoena NRMC-F 0135]|nr:DUF4174 domain-containing protein [Oscillatoria amoena NRMC-F 0135]